MLNSTPVLTDLRVLDLSEDIPGPYCTKLLAGLGATVIKVEPPGRGDRSRSAGPFVHEAPHPEESATFLYLNTSKQSITLDVTSAAGATILRQLISTCDILVENFSPGSLKVQGLDYRSLEPHYPHLIYTSITPFGQDGPYRDYQGSDLVLQALGALMHPVGLPDQEPLKIGGQTALYTIGISAFSATMLALHVRDTMGYGQLVDVSGMETLTVAQIRASIQHQFGSEPKRQANPLMQAQDGWVHAGLERGIGEDTWTRVCDLMGTPELADDPKFNTREARRANQQDLKAIISEWTATRPKEEIYHALQKLRTVAGYVATVEDLFTSEQFAEREFFQPLDHPYAGTASYPGNAFTMQGLSWQHQRAPLLGEHNSEVYGQLGYSAKDLARFRGLGVI